MTLSGCQFDQDVRMAAIGGRWTSALSAHVATCPACGETRLVVETLRRRPTTATSRPAADPSALWACGRHARRIAAETRIDLVVTATEIGVLLGVLGALLSSMDWRELWGALAAFQWRVPTWTVAALSLATIAFAGLSRWISQTR